MSRQPRLLMNSPSALRLRFQLLAELTRCGTSMTLDTCSNAGWHVLIIMSCTASLCSLSDLAMRKMMRQQPALLSYFPETLEGRRS